MATLELVQRFRAELERLRLSDVEAAAISGLSLPTIRRVRSSCWVPKQRRSFVAISFFVTRARSAGSRGDLTLPAEMSLTAA